MKIPKIIHHVWGGKDIPCHISTFIKKSQDSIKETHSSWEYKLWLDDDINSLVKDRFPEYYDYWSLYPDNDIKKWDISRYLIILAFGGMYVDIDCVFLKNMDNIIDFNKSYSLHKKPGWKNWIDNHFLLSKPNRDLWKTFMSQIMRTPNKCNPHYHTGGIGLFRCARHLDQSEIQFLPPSCIINRNFKHQAKPENFDYNDVHLLHHVDSIWRK